MQNLNRSISNPPLRELNAINISQKTNNTLNTSLEVSKILPFRPMKEPENSFETRIQKTSGLEGDRPGLVLRIAKQQQEIETLNKENSDLHLRLVQERARFEEFQKKVSHSSKVKNLVDKNYLGDLKYEREENLRLKHLLQTLELERNELRNKVREIEAYYSSGVHEKNEVMGRLQQKIDHVHIVEGDNRVLADKISLMHSKMHSFEKENSQIANENEKMKVLLGNLEVENQEILKKVDEECKKYSNFVNAKNDELSNVRWVFRRQLKVQSVNFMFSSFSKYLIKRMYFALVKLKGFTECRDKVLWTLRKMDSNAEIGRLKRLKKGYSAFKRLVSSVGSSKITKNFIGKFSYLKFAGKVFLGWRKAVQLEVKERSVKGKSAKKLIKFLGLHIRNCIEFRIEHWKLVVKFGDKKRKIMEKLVKNHRSRSIGLRFLYWKKAAVLLRHFQSVEDLSTDFAGKLITIRFFSAFRDYIKGKLTKRKILKLRKSHLETVKKQSILAEIKRITYKHQEKNNKLKGILLHVQQKGLNFYLQKWKLDHFHTKNTNKYESVLSYVKSKEKQQLLLSTLLSWKSFTTNRKLQKAENELSIEKPKRSALESSLEELALSHSKNLQKTALKLITNPMYKVIKQAFTQWLALKNRFKGQLPKIRHLFLKHCHLAVLKGFKTWKQVVLDKNISALRYKNEKNLLEKIELNQQLLNLSDILKSKQSNLQHLSQTRIKRCISYMILRDLSNSFKTWHKKSKIKSAKSRSAFEIRKTYFKILSRVSFGAIKNKAKSSKLKLIRGKKLQKSLILRFKDSICLTFTAWKTFTRTMKNFRKIVSGAYAKKENSNRLQAWTTWKDFIGRDNFQNLLYKNQKLAECQSGLEKELFKYKALLEESSLINRNLEKIVKNKGKKRVTLALIKGCTEKWKRCWNKWKILLQKFAVLQKKSKKIIHCWVNKELRKAWHEWTFVVNTRNKKSAAVNLEKHKREFSQFKMETKKARGLLEGEIQESSQKLEQVTQKMSKAERLNEYLLAKTLKDVNENFAVTRTGYYFSIMKGRYLKVKKVLSVFSKTLRTSNIRRGLKDIKGYCLELIKIGSLKNMLENVFRRYEGRFLRNEFDRWCRHAWHINEIRLTTSLKSQTSKLTAAMQKQKLIKMKNREKFLRIFISKNKSFFFGLWRKVFDSSKSLKFASCQFRKLQKTLRSKLAFSSLIENLQINKRSKLKSLKAMSLCSFNTVRLYFSEWKSLHQSLHYLTKILSKTRQKFSVLMLTHSFNQIRSHSAIARYSSVVHTNKKLDKLKTVFFRRFCKSLQFSFKVWLGASRIWKSSNKVLKSSVLRALHRKLRSAFDLWNEDILLKDTVEVTNTQGTVAIENSILKGRINILNQLIRTEGLDPKYVEKFILEKENQQSALTIQSISLKKYRSGLVNPNDRVLVPKHFLIWKQWVIKRKKIVKTAARVLCYLRKADIFHCFLKWKHGFALIINSVSKLPRRNLFSLIAKLDVDIKTLESKLEVTHKSLLYYQTYSEIMTSQVRRGQNMALISCGLQQQKSMLQVFNRWAYYTNLCKVQDFLEQLTSTEQNLYIVKTTLKNLEEENLNLVEENYELRQASLDGVAIAEAFETLTKERERLSIDLAERTATIKKLIDQNNELADKLRSVGFDDTPEREVLKSRRYF